MRTVTAVLCLSLACIPCFAGGSPSQEHFLAPREIPSGMLDAILARQGEFRDDLESVLSADRDGLLALVDRGHPLLPSFVPPGLVTLGTGRSYLVNREGLELRAPAEAALERMARAARKDGVSLVASSAWRSFEYQKTVYERNVKELGQAAAARESARPGTSQHHLGTAVDFGSITDSFADTAAGKWLAVHAGAWGWSLSFPQGYEAVTGYRWECWHYRYVGREAAAFQKKWFGDVQQYMILYLDAWRRTGGPAGARPSR
jgi:D-alanyl-D-alanine carboxypeptidase